jgi:hypothetical protein
MIRFILSINSEDDKIKSPKKFPFFFKELQKEVLIAAKKYDLVSNENHEIEKHFDNFLKTEMKENQRPEEIEFLRKILDYLKKIFSCDFHYSISLRQRKAYNEMKKNFPSDCILVE